MCETETDQEVTQLHVSQMMITTARMRMMRMVVHLQVIVECNEVLGCVLYVHNTTSTTVSC